MFAVLALCASAGCGERAPDPAPEPAPPPAAAPPASAPVAQPQRRPGPARGEAPAAAVVDRGAVQRAIARFEAVLREPAGDPRSPWALAHGLLAFGKDFRTRDGRSAVQVAASFAERSGEGGGYRFPLERDGQPVEPHAHLIVKTFLEVGLPVGTPLRARDGAKLDLKRLLADMAASVRLPASDAQWHDAAWWMASLAMHPVRGAPEPSALREAALKRLEADDAVLEVALDAEPFAPSAPMGAAKRGKTHIFGHPCGGLHFVQAVLRSTAASEDAAVRARARAQLSLLLDRYEAERALYATTLEAHPTAALMVSGQQLKFFGHLLETLALAAELGLLREDAPLAERVAQVRRRTTFDTLATLERLDAERAYENLEALEAKRPQLRLDLIGDGCHALHGLREVLKTMPEG